MASNPILGQFQLFAFNNILPRGFVPCNGQLLNISQNPALYAVLGTTYGGNGTTTFAVPDLRSRIAIGKGQGPGLTNRALGEKGGKEKTVLTAAQLPSHTHLLAGGIFGPSVSSQEGTSTVPTEGGANVLGALVDLNAAATNNLYTSATPDILLNTGTTINNNDTSLPAGSQHPYPFSIIPPALGLNYCLCTVGIYPTRP